MGIKGLRAARRSLMTSRHICRASLVRRVACSRKACLVFMEDLGLPLFRIGTMWLDWRGPWPREWDSWKGRSKRKGQRITDKVAPFQILKDVWVVSQNTSELFSAPFVSTSVFYLKNTIMSHAYVTLLKLRDSIFIKNMEQSSWKNIPSSLPNQTAITKTMNPK